MKVLNKLISVLIITVIIASAFCFNVAAANSVIALSAKSVEIGQTVTVTVTIRADEEMYATEGYIDYNSGVLEYSSGGSSALASPGTVKIVGTPGGAKSQSYSITFVAKAEGSSGITFRDVVYVGENSNSVQGAGVSVTVSKPAPAAPKSSNANLSSLKVSGATLSPEFNSNTTSYTAEVPFETEQVSISANAVDNGTFTGGGTFNLKVGDNVRYIKVTAEDRSTSKTYKITIVRAAEDPEIQKLLNVQIDGVDYRIVTEAPVSPLTGFNITTVKRGNMDVSVMQSEDGKLNIYTLKNVGDEKTDYYVYNEDEDKFQLLPYAIISDRMYIFTNQKDLTAKGYTKTTLSLGNATVDAFVSNDEKLQEFYIVYCYVDGKGCYYSYDTVENTMQRVPAFEVSTTTESDEKENTEEDKQVISSVKDITKLGKEAKAIIIVMAVVVLCVIALIVLIIVRYVKLRKYDEEDDEFGFDDDLSIFDEINVVDTLENNEQATEETDEE